jgi:hypothetical protein
MHPDDERLLSILYLTVKAFKFHCKKTVTLAFPCGEVLVTEADGIRSFEKTSCERKNERARQTLCVTKLCHL